jgi:tetratricopeptide (TPR) repeat protein
MKTKAKLILVVVFSFFLTVEAKAETAGAVFEQASQSTVVVLAYDGKGAVAAFGSGVVLPDGSIATNCHVIEKGATLAVQYQQQKHPAKRRYTDRGRDTCTLFVPGLKAPSVKLGSTKGLKVGDRVYAIGAPKGLELTLSEGIVSSLRPIAGGQYIQTTAAISPGSSGGGLFDRDGRLLGLVSFYMAEGQNLNFALPVEWIVELPKRQMATTTKTEKTTVDWLNRAIALDEKEDWAGLEKHALAWSKAEPKNSLAWFSLSIAYRQNGQTTKAIETYQQALRIDPEHALAWSGLGVAYRQTGQYVKAIEAYQQALRIDPEYYFVWVFLGAAYDKTGQTAKAIEAYQQALRIDPENAETWFNLGVAYGNNGQTAKEIEAYQQTLRIDPEYASAWFNLGIAYRQNGQTTKAIEAYQQAIRINPEYAAAWNNLGIAYKVNGQSSKVMEVYKRLKTLDPDMADKFFNKIILP